MMEVKEYFKQEVKSREGFSLVEIIVASVLLAIVCAGIFSITLSSKKVINVSSQRNTATEVAQTALDNLRAYLGDDNWTDNPASPFLTSGWQGYYDFSDGQAAFIDSVADVFRGSEFDTVYNGRWRYQVINPGTDYRKVEVEVAWDEINI